jgi:hypothetical protein
MAIHPTILIFSLDKDLHVRAVINRLPNSSLPLVCDLSHFGVTLAATVDLHDTDADLVLVDRLNKRFSLNSVESVWWRRPTAFSFFERCGDDAGKYIIEEYNHFWGGLLGLLRERGIRFYNDPLRARDLDRKLVQLSLARKCGLAIPETIVTSDPCAANEFIATHTKIVFKSFSGSERVWRPTRLFKTEMAQHLWRLPLCPVIFQTYIEGVRDYRVTIIDDRVTSAAFDITASRYPADVRIDTKIPCFRRALPAAVEACLALFMRVSGLRYGAFDLRETPSGEFFFLEVNESGQFLYIDQLAGTGIAQDMADALGAGKPAGEFDERTLTPTDAQSQLNFDVDAPFALVTPYVTHHFT